MNEHWKRQNHWEKRRVELNNNALRERKGLYYLALSIISILGGVAGLTYGLAGLAWIQKPYVVMGGLLILFGMSFVLGGFGKVRKGN